MKFIRKWYQSLRLKQKALTLYLLFGICITLPLAAGASVLLHNYLLRQKQETMSHSLYQAVQQIESEIALYNALSDYIFNNNDIVSALNLTYTDNYFEMYVTMENKLIPTLRTQQLLGTNIDSIAIYTDSGLPSYKKYIFPLEKLQTKNFFQKIEGHYSTQWLISDEKNDQLLILSRKLIQNHAYPKNNYLYISIDYPAFFQSFSSLDCNGTAIFLTDEEEEIIYSSKSMDTVTDNPYQLIKNSEECLNVTEKFSTGWTAYYCLSSADFFKAELPVIAILWLVIILLIAVLFCCTYYISGTIIRPIVNLSEQVQRITDASLTETLTTTRTDEIGELTIHFNQMIQEVYANKLQTKEYQIKALHAQINPHFLYNALGLINNKAIIAGQDDISHMALLLSRFYRTCLNNAKDTTTIGNELKNIQMYIEIQKIMYNNAIDISYQIDDSLLNITMPNFILQPIIENAIEHGLRNDKKSQKKLNISLTSKGSDCLFLIQDNGKGMTEEQLAGLATYETSGIGISNIDKRLRLYYGENYGVSIISQKDRGTSVYIKIAQQSPAR